MGLKTINIVYLTIFMVFFSFNQVILQSQLVNHAEIKHIEIKLYES